MMVSKSAHLYRTSVKSFAIAAVAGLAACSGDANPVRDIATSVGAGPTMAKTPDFVRESRPANLDYLPVGTTAPARPSPAKTADEVKAAEAEMDALKARNESAAQAAIRAGSTPAPKPAAASPQQSAASAKKKPKKQAR
jgi:hypothetical protein